MGESALKTSGLFSGTRQNEFQGCRGQPREKVPRTVKVFLPFITSAFGAIMECRDKRMGISKISSKAKGMENFGCRWKIARLVAGVRQGSCDCEAAESSANRNIDPGSRGLFLNRSGYGDNCSIECADWLGRSRIGEISSS